MVSAEKNKNTYLNALCGGFIFCLKHAYGALNPANGAKIVNYL